MTDAAVMRIGVCGGDGEAENGQAENGKQNLFHGNLLSKVCDGWIVHAPLR